MKTQPSKIWAVFLCISLLLLSYLLVNNWKSDVDFESIEQNDISEEHVVFITMKEKSYGTKKRGFDSLLESLKAWEYDEPNKEVRIKYSSLLPKTSTKAVVVYDKGFDSFEKHEEILSIDSFPYLYNFNEEPLFTLHYADAHGTAFINYKGNTVKLEQGNSIEDTWIENFKLHRMEITNHGIFPKENFKLLKDEK